MSEDTIFGKIIRKEIPTDFLYEDDKCVAFKDIHPKAPTHILIVSKKPIPSIFEMSENEDKEIVGHMVYVSKKIAEERGLNGYMLKIHVGKDGGQEIFHLHIHLTSQFAS